MRFANHPLRRKLLAAVLGGCGLTWLTAALAASGAVLLVRGVGDSWPGSWLAAVVLAGVLVLAGLGAAVWIAVRLQEAVAVPIINLARSAQSADVGGPLLPRVVQESDDEVGQLVGAFNDLLEQLAQREDSLRRANAELTRQGEALARQLAQQQQTEQDVKEREARLRLLLERVPAVIWTTDWELRVTSSTGGRLGDLQLQGQEAVGRTLYEYFGTTDPTFPSIAAHRRALAGERVTFEQDWQGHHFHVQVEPLVDDAQQVIGVTGVAVDATEAQRAADFCRRVLETAPDPIFTIRADGVIASLNPAFERYTGWTREDWLGQPYEPLLHPDDRELARVLFGEVIRGRTPPIYEVRCRTRSGEYLVAQLNVAPLKEGDEVRGFLGVARDVTRERQLQQQVLEISAREQARIGRDLHDGLCQDLVGTAFCATGLENELRRAQHPAAATAAEVAAMLEQAVSQARDLARGLHPVQLGAGNLSAALTGLAAQTGRVYDLGCEFQERSAATVTDDVAATHLYRIAQEAVSNAARHGRPRRIRIELGRDQEREYLRVTDDGCGMQDRPGASFRPGLGIQLMEYRARAIGGTLEVAPAADGGTRVTCRWLPPAATEGG